MRPVWQIARLALMLSVAVLATVALLQAMAHATWSLSGAGSYDLNAVSALNAPDRRPDPQAIRYHVVTDWSGPRRFQQSPTTGELAQQLPWNRASKTLPPLVDRLPQDPPVIVPPHQHGPYGGEWTRVATSQSDIGTVIMNRICYDTFLRWDPLVQKLEPNLSYLPEVQEDGKAFVFRLRRGVRWSDGQPFTAHDVVFWYEHVLLNKDLTPSINQAFVRANPETGKDEPMRVTATDDYTLRFEFAAPNGLFVQQMASEMFAAQMVNQPKHYLRQFHPSFLADELRKSDPSLTDQQAYGKAKASLEAAAAERGLNGWYALFGDRSGWRNPEMPRLWAWVLTREPVSGKPVTFVRNPFYWKVDDKGNQLPYIDRLTFRIFENRENITLQAIGGHMGMQGRHLLFANYPLIMRNAEKHGYRVLHWYDANGGKGAIALNLNHKDPQLRKIFNDKRFRIALSHAINRDEMNQVGFFGIGTPRQMAPPPQSRYAWPEYANAHLAYDPGKTNQLLDEMGLDRRDRTGVRLRPDGKPLHIFIEVSSASIQDGNLELVVDYWSRVGVKTEIKMTARQLFYQRKDALQHDVGTWGGGDEVIPLLDPRWFLPFSTESLHAIGNARWFLTSGREGMQPTGDLRRCVDLYSEIQSTFDDQRQQQLFREILKLNKDNLWVIGTVGELPFPIVMQDSFVNVPEAAVYGWIMKSPSNTAPECYAIDPDLTSKGDR